MGAGGPGAGGMGADGIGAEAVAVTLNAGMDIDCGIVVPAYLNSALANDSIAVRTWCGLLARALTAQKRWLRIRAS